LMADKAALRIFAFPRCRGSTCRRRSNNEHRERNPEARERLTQPIDPIIALIRCRQRRRGL
jgi:hypothetical protein